MGHQGKRRVVSCPPQSQSQIQSQSHVVIILLDCLIWKTTEKLVPWCSMRVSMYYELLKYNWHVHWLLSIHNEPFLSMNIRSLRRQKVLGSRNGVYGTPWWDMFVEWLKSYDCYLWLRSSSLSLITGLQSVQLINKIMLSIYPWLLFHPYSTCWILNSVVLILFFLLLLLLLFFTFSCLLCYFRFNKLFNISWQHTHA